MKPSSKKTNNADETSDKIQNCTFPGEAIYTSRTSLSPINCRKYVKRNYLYDRLER